MDEDRAFDLARDYASLDGLSAEDREQVLEVRRVLDAVDRSWVLPPERQARIREKFLERLRGRT